MGIGESLTDFIARINGLMEEAENLGEVFSQQTRMVMVATRLREPWRQQANDKMDRDNDLNYSKLVQHLFLRQRGEAQERSIETYVANVGTTERRDQGGSRGQWSQSGRGDNQWEEGEQIEAEAEGEAEIQGEEFQIILVQIVERKDTGEEHAPIHHVAIFVGDQDICPMTVKRTQPTWLEYLWWMMKGGIEI